MDYLLVLTQHLRRLENLFIDSLAIPLLDAAHFADVAPTNVVSPDSKHSRADGRYETMLITPAKGTSTLHEPVLLPS
jgi:hypothetical protein